MRYLICLFSLVFMFSCDCKKEKSVFLSVTAKNKEHLLPRFLKCIDKLDYDKKAITVHILTGCNEDGTETLLRNWAEEKKDLYHGILFETTEDAGFDQDLTSAPFKEKVLEHAKEQKTDYCFIVSPTSFIASSTLKTLMSKDVPVVAPMLRAIPELNDHNSNFFADVNEYGYFKHHPDYNLILEEEKKGTFEVPVIHCTYLIKCEYLDRLSYSSENPDFEFLSFGRHARKNEVGQYICNEENFGVYVHFFGEPSLEEQKTRLQYILNLPSL